MKKTKIITIIASILLVSLILRFGFALTHLNHDCTHDDNCPTCMIINKLRSDLDGTALDIVQIISAVLIITLFTKNVYEALINKRKETLIGLKVQMNN